MGVGGVGRELRPWWRSVMTSVSPRPAGNDASAGIVEQAMAVLEAELAAPPAPGSAAPSPMGEPMFCAVAHGRPGQTIQLVLGLLNEQPTQPVQVQLFCTDARTMNERASTASSAPSARSKRSRMCAGSRA